MTEPKKHRTDWTIEPSDSSWPINAIQYYKHQIDMDNVHYCSTVEEAEREIDDAIILEQEQVIDRLCDALRDSSSMLFEGEFSLRQVDLVRHQIKHNDSLIKAYMS